MSIFELYLQTLSWIRAISRTAHAVIILSIAIFGTTLVYGFINPSEPVTGVFMRVAAGMVLVLTGALFFVAWKALAMTVLRSFEPTGNVLVDALEWLVMVIILAPLYGILIMVKIFFG